MLRLNLKKEPYWLDLPSEVRVQVKPLTNAVMNAAQNFVIKEMISLREADNLPTDESTKVGLSESLLIKVVARISIIEWEGILNADGTSTMPVTDDNVNDLMDIWFIAQDFWKKYTSSLTALVSEGNLSKPSQHGISVVDQNIAGAVVNKDCRVVKARRTKKQANSAHT